eukprot:TRINITY_DN15199_c0_g1_i1.p1 TRINITY_DN15199_c0_g1~~TRINITY_DN15199_c0_g1_i1.p1  ORF type:complete len:169 (+),score=7.57 TRINITY_DN15199_c0_g1_i1:68-508(+)
MWSRQSSSTGLRQRRKVIKRAVPHSIPAATDLYITHGTPTSAYRDRVLKLFRSPNVPCVVLHALGAQISRCCALALEIQNECLHSVRLLLETGSVPLTADVLPVDELQEDGDVSERVGSSVRICVQKSLEDPRSEKRKKKRKRSPA